VRRLGKRTAYIVGCAVSATGLVVAAMAPTAIVAFIALAVGMLGILLVNMLVWALEADTVEYGEWKTGVRTEGITYALFSFTRKTGQAFGGALAAYAIGIGGYVAGAEVQTASSEWGIRAAAAIVPAVCIVLAAIVMLTYPLTDTRHQEIVREIAARREESAASGASPAQDASLSTAAFAAATMRPGRRKR
jgi:glucuronide carrier protein